jgi:hypothetical protein
MSVLVVIDRSSNILRGVKKQKKTKLLSKETSRLSHLTTETKRTGGAISFGPNLKKKKKTK